MDWQTLIVAVVVAVLSSLLAPLALIRYTQRRQRRVARRLVAHELQRLYLVVVFAQQIGALGGWSERLSLQPPLPAWTKHGDVLADELDEQPWRVVRNAQQTWDEAYLLYGQTPDTRFSMTPLLQAIDMALDALDNPSLSLGTRLRLKVSRSRPTTDV